MTMKKSTKIIIPLLLAFVLLAAGSAPFFAEAAGRNKGLGLNMGDKNKITVTAEKKKLSAEQAAVDKALAASDYNAWVKAVGPNSPMLKKINAGNFPKLVEIYKLHKQIQIKMSELGLEQGPGVGMMMGVGCNGECMKNKPASSSTCPMAEKGGCGMTAKTTGGCAHAGATGAKGACGMKK